MTIYKGENIYEFMWKDFQNYQGDLGTFRVYEPNRDIGTIREHMKKYEKWRMEEQEVYNILKQVKKQ